MNATKEDFSLQGLNEDVLGGVIKKLEPCDILMFKLSCKEVHCSSFMRAVALNQNSLIKNACKVGVLPVMEYLYNVLKYKYDIWCLFTASREKVGCFRWILNLNSGVTLSTLIHAYADLACESSIFDVVEDAYGAIETRLPKSDLQEWSPYVCECLRIYNKWCLTIDVTRILPQECCHHIYELAASGTPYIGTYNLINVVPLLEKLTKLPFIWSMIARHALNAEHFSLASYLINRYLIMKSEVMDMCQDRYSTLGAVNHTKAQKYVEYMNSLKD